MHLLHYTKTAMHLLHYNKTAMHLWHYNKTAMHLLHYNNKTDRHLLHYSNTDNWMYYYTIILHYKFHSCLFAEISKWKLNFDLCWKADITLAAEKPQNWNFFSKKVEIEFWLVLWLVLKSWNNHSFVNISPTVIIDASMERSTWVLQQRNTKK